MTADPPGRSRPTPDNQASPGQQPRAGHTGRRTGRPPLTDRAALLVAARELGFVGLTVGAVTTRVGVKYSTFYRHFPSLTALTAAMVDDVFAELELPDTDTGWQTYLTDTAAALAELLARHPGLATAAVGLPELPARVLTACRGMTDGLLGAGFTPEQAALAASTVLHTAATPWLISPSPGPTAANRARQLAATDEPIDPRVREATAVLVTDARTWVPRTIDQLIRGLDAPRSRTPPGDEPNGSTYQAIPTTAKTRARPAPPLHRLRYPGPASSAAP